MSKDIKDMTPDELEELRRTVRAKSRWWLWGDKPSPQERQVALLAAHYSGSKGKTPGVAQARASKVREGGSSAGGSSNVPNSFLPPPSRSSRRADRAAVPAHPINQFDDGERPGPRAEVDSYIGPCYECLYECTRLISIGDSTTADLILGSCRHNLLPGHPAISPNPVDLDSNLTSAVETRLQSLTSGMPDRF